MSPRLPLSCAAVNHNPNVGLGAPLWVLTEALARGGKVVWDHPERPRLLAPPSLHDAIKTDRATVKEILRRAAIF